MVWLSVEGLFIAINDVAQYEWSAVDPGAFLTLFFDHHTRLIDLDGDMCRPADG